MFKLNSFSVLWHPFILIHYQSVLHVTHALLLQQFVLFDISDFLDGPCFLQKVAVSVYHHFQKMVYWLVLLWLLFHPKTKRFSLASVMLHKTYYCNELKNQYFFPKANIFFWNDCVLQHDEHDLIGNCLS